MTNSLIKTFLLIMSFCIVSSCDNSTKTYQATKDDKLLLQKAKAYISPLPLINRSTLSPSQKKIIDLGEKLFLDTILSYNKTQSCNTCHPLDKFGMDNKRVSEGDNKRFGTRNTPTVYNAALQFAQFWDAHVKTIEEQASGPIFGADEMGIPDTLYLLNRFYQSNEYVTLFNQAYPDNDSSITIETITQSLGAFQKTLVTSNDKFDQFLNGNMEILNSKEKRGLNTFIDKGCIPCHSGSLLGGNMSQKFAVYGYYWDYTGSDFLDKGKFKHTKDANDKFVFKVPTLRNISKTYPYLHDGSVEKLSDAIRIMAQSELNTSLSNKEIDNIEAFLGTLTK